ncbi:MAG: DUF4129 domain-containing protein [Armatimonadetes bacterium]|nr:DUF4129 domain-containing protein [Armatimonadota bacterium]
MEEEIKSVLSRREFRKRGPSASEQFREWLYRLLQQLGFRTPELGLGKGSVDLLQLLVLIAASGGFLFLIYYAVRFGIRRVQPEVVRPAASGKSEETAAPETYFREAEALAAQGEYREALERAYVGTLLHLGRGRALEFNPNRTNWENLRTLRRDFPDDLARMLRRISRLFDRKWYGHEAIGEPEYRRASEELARVREGLARMKPAPGGAPVEAPVEVPA